MLGRLSEPCDKEDEDLAKSFTSNIPIVIRLSGHVHTNDRLALKEIGRQLMTQCNAADLEFSDEEEEADEGDGELDRSRDRWDAQMNENMGDGNIAASRIFHSFLVRCTASLEHLTIS